MLFGLFARKEDKILSRIGVDVHSHLIPGIDDGAKDYEISLLCIREIVKQGVKKIYVTPHFQTRRFNNDEDDVRKVVFKKNIGGVSDMERNRNIRENDFNRIIDEAFDNHPDGSLGDEDISNLASALVSRAFDDVISEALGEKEDNAQNYNEDYEDLEGYEDTDDYDIIEFEDNLNQMLDYFDEHEDELEGLDPEEICAKAEREVMSCKKRVKSTLYWLKAMEKYCLTSPHADEIGVTEIYPMVREAIYAYLDKQNFYRRYRSDDM